VASLYYLKHLLSIIEELSSSYYLKFSKYESIKYKKRRKRRLYNSRKMKILSARRPRRLKKLTCLRRGSV